MAVVKQLPDGSFVLFCRLLSNPAEYCLVQSDIEEVEAGEHLKVQRGVDIVWRKRLCPMAPEPSSSRALPT
jgi:hypothetical protein